MAQSVGQELPPIFCMHTFGVSTANGNRLTLHQHTNVTSELCMEYYLHCSYLCVCRLSVRCGCGHWNLSSLLVLLHVRLACIPTRGPQMGTMLAPPFIGTHIETVHNAVCRQDKERVLCEVLGTSERISNLQINTIPQFCNFYFSIHLLCTRYTK